MVQIIGSAGGLNALGRNNPAGGGWVTSVTRLRLVTPLVPPVGKMENCFLEKGDFRSVTERNRVTVVTVAAPLQDPLKDGSGPPSRVYSTSGAAHD